MNSNGDFVFIFNVGGYIFIADNYQYTKVRKQESPSSVQTENTKI